jgi:PEP-CTERM motif-containing protein
MSPINFRKIAVSLAIFAVVALGSSSVARADNFFFSQSGSIDGNPVSATANLSGTAGTNTLTLVLTNTSLGHESVHQALVGFQFTICDAQGNLLMISVTGISSQSGRTVSFNNSTTATDINGPGADTLNWGLNATLGVTALGFTGSGNPPDEAILGPADSGLTYNGANPSITNNGPHQPFVVETATFTLTLSGNLPDGFCICPDVTFFFNTDGTPLTNVPEPMSMLLFGTGLLGVGAAVRRRIRKS